jgi:hypothetical protein
MPNVVVYLRAQDERLLTEAGKDPGQWVRDQVRNALEAFEAPPVEIPGQTKVSEGGAEEPIRATPRAVTPAAPNTAAPSGFRGPDPKVKK